MANFNFPFDTSVGLLFDTAKMLVSAGAISLKLQDDPDNDFEETFDSDAGFTYDSDKAEFSGGQVQQKMYLPDSSALFGTNYYEDANPDFMFGNGSLTGILTGGTVHDGVMDLKGNTGSKKYCDFADGGAILAGSELKGTIVIDWIPNYTGTPSGIRGIMLIKNPSNYNWMVNVMHQSTDGDIYIYLYNGTGGSHIVLHANYSPVAGQHCEIGISWDFETIGVLSLYINKTRVATAQNASYLSVFATRVWTDMDIRFGSDSIAAWYADAEFDSIIGYSDYLLTGATYVTEYKMPDYLYAETEVILPEMEYTGAGTLIAATDFVTSFAGSPRLAIQIGRSGDWLYWDGADWTVNDDTYDQATDPATFAANIATLPVNGEIYGQFKIYFTDLNTISDFADLLITLTSQIYPTDNPKCVIASNWYIDEILNFVETATKTGSDEIKYILKKGTSWYYWTGSAWAVSDETYAQSSTATDILMNIDSFTESGIRVYFGVAFFLHSETGLTTPSLDEISIDYDYAGETPDTINTCIVWGFFLDELNVPNTEPFFVYLKNDNVQYKEKTMIVKKKHKVTPRASDGYAEVELIETENMVGTQKYIFEFKKSKPERSIPNEATKNFFDLI